MKIKQLFTYCLLASTFLLASCDNETLPDGDGAGTPLPEGMYPLTFTATQNNSGGVQTRVSENSDGMGSQWTVGDQIKVVVSDGGNAAETTCTLDRSGNITAYNPKLYWQTTQNSKVNAWYSNISGQSTASSTVSLANQTGGLAYVLKADEKTGVNYQSGNIQLQFKYQLAKVRVKVVKGTYTGNLNITGVKVKGYTSCTVSKGMVSNGGNTNYIAMKKNGDYYEANLVPGLALQTEAFEITADGNTTKATLNAAVTPAKGNVHTITITMDAAWLTPDKPITISDDGEYTITGSGDQTITISGGSPTITLKDVEVKAETAINITGGNPKLVFEGKGNKLESTGAQHGAISLSGNASVDISGGGILNLKASYPDQNGIYGAVLGSAPGQTGGNISISDITLNIAANMRTAAIGSGSGNSSCGDIIIKNATIEITGGCGGAGIGTSVPYSGSSSCGDIKITNSDITISYGNYFAYQGAAIGCGSPWDYKSPITVKGIYITLKSGQSKDNFLSNLKTTSATGSDKVGQGFVEGSSKGGTITNGIHWYNADGDSAN